MNKIKVKIYKDPEGKGQYINKTANFLQKAQAGIQVDAVTLQQDILDQLTLTTDVEEIADELSVKYQVPYFDMLTQVEDVVGLLYRQDVNDTKNEMLSENPNIEKTPVIKKPLYSTDEEWISDDNAGWDDSEEDDLASEDTAALSIEKKGGSVNKSRFVKKIVKGLRKAAEGMEQDESTNATILDAPNGRESFKRDFKRGIKDLGNEFYAKEIYDKTKELQQQTSSLPSGMNQMQMAEEGMQMEQTDIENPMHHLEAYSGSVSNIFKQPMNQVHGAGFENLPEARRGREQRQAARQARKVDKDFRNMFGDIAAGYMGVPGMPNYLQVISPQMMSQQVNPAAAMSGQTGPLIDFEYKKGPWWSGKREWSAKGIPAQMLMGMAPSFGYMPMNVGYNSSYSNYRTYPGEVVKTKTKVINSVADPSKNNKESVILKNNPENNSQKAFTYNQLLRSTPEGRLEDDSNRLSAINKSDQLVKSGLYKDDPDTFYREDALYTGPVPFQEFASLKKKVDKLMEENDMYPAQLRNAGLITQAEYDNYKSRGYITKDPTTGYEYSTEFPYAPDILNKMNDLYELQDLDYQTKELTDRFLPPQQEEGGVVDISQMDPNMLTKFVYGGDDLPIEPIVQYEDDNMNYRNTEDPFMFRDGGLYKYEPGGIRANSPAPGYTWEQWEALPEATRAKISQSLQSQNQARTQTQGRSYPLGYYPTAPRLGRQILDMFSPFKRNPYTGKNYDYMWMSQRGPARTADGQIYNPQAAMQGQKYAEAIDEYGNKKIMTLDQAERQGLQHKEIVAPSGGGGYKIEYPYTNPITGQTVTGPQNQQNPIQPGYMYDYTFKKGPWWKGNEKTMTVTGRWVDPNNPNAGMVPTDNRSRVNQTDADKDTIPDYLEVAGPNNIFEEEPIKETRRQAIRRAKKLLFETPDEIIPSKTSTKTPVATTPNIGVDRFLSEGEEMNPEAGFEFGGYVPYFQPGGQFSGAGPFDANANNVATGINQRETGACTEFEVQDPNSPCYDPNYKPENLQTPQDFTAEYEINKARTLNTGNIANAMQFTGNAAQNVSGALESNYNKNYLAANTTSDNMEPKNQLDFRGGDSRLTGRNMSKTQGAGATGFNSVVGNAAFVKEGGQLEYRQGGVYDLTQEEIGQILAAGGQIKFL